MKTIHNAECDCCPPDNNAMKLWADSVDDKFSWGVEQPCPLGHHQLTTDGAALKVLHREAVDAEQRSVNYILPTMPTAEHQLAVCAHTALMHGEPPFKRWWLASNGAVMFGDEAQRDYEAEQRGVTFTHLYRNDPRVWAAKRAIEAKPDATMAELEMACGIGL